MELVDDNLWSTPIAQNIRTSLFLEEQALEDQKQENMKMSLSCSPRLRLPQGPSTQPMGPMSNRIANVPIPDAWGHPRPSLPVKNELFPGIHAEDREPDQSEDLMQLVLLAEQLS